MRRKHPPIDRGQRHGTLLVLRSYGRAKDGHVIWRCACTECGKVVDVAANNLRKAKSCGCIAVGKRTHGMRQSKEYRAWQAIKNRCLKPGNKDYPRYGGIGLTVEPEWVDSFSCFLADVGQAPTAEHQIDRIDNTLGYLRGNVRWATKSEQQRNKRNRCTYLFSGEVYEAAADLAALFNVTTTTICRWAKAGKHGIKTTPRYAP